MLEPHNSQTLTKFTSSLVRQRKPSLWTVQQLSSKSR